MKLSYKLAIMIVSITMLSVIISGVLFVANTSGVVKARISDQLKSISTLKENQLTNYISRSNFELENLASSPLVVWYSTQFSETHNLENNTNLTSKLKIFLEVNPNYAIEFNKKYSLNESQNAIEIENLEELFEDKVVDYLDSQVVNSEFDELSIVTINGVVDLSTINDEKGKIKSNEKYFINGLNSTYVQNFYIPVSTREPAMMISTPIYSAEGKVVGVLVGSIRLNQISDIMVERSGLGDTGETILINKNHLLVTESRFINNISFKKTIYNKGINECLLGKTGIKEYTDYRNIKVIGFLSWMPEREVCLVTKIDQKEVYGFLSKLYLKLLIFGTIFLIFSLLIAYFVSRNLTKSITILVNGTEQWAKGNLGHNITITSDDEIATLCKAFNDASREMLHSRELAKNYTKDLKKELEKKTREMTINLKELEKSKNASLNIMDDLSETNKHLKDLDKAKTDFLNVASHELKTPLTAISAYLEILDDYKGQFSKEQLQGLDAIKRNSNTLKMLIGNILEISRLESGRFDLNITEVNIKEKIVLLVDNLKILSDNKHIELKYDCSDVEKIYTDEMRFEEILTNLIGNAIKFTDKGAVNVKVEFGKDKEKGFVVISVIDTGVGISEDNMTNLFKKFYQVDASVSRRYGGTGLGLSITKKMIELQSGKISVNSIAGKGTTFRFTLPISPTKKTTSAIALIDTNYNNPITNPATNPITSTSKNPIPTQDTIVDSNTLKKYPKKGTRTRSNSKQINRHTSKKKNNNK